MPTSIDNREGLSSAAAAKPLSQRAMEAFFDASALSLPPAMRDWREQRRKDPERFDRDAEQFLPAIRAIVAVVQEDCAMVAESIGKSWHRKEQSYRKAGNPGPYLGTPTGFTIAETLRARGEVA